MAFLTRALVWTAFTPLIALSSGYTIRLRGDAVPADGDTLAPALAVVAPDSTDSSVDYFEFETSQLTDGVLANLTDVGLSGVDQFEFADSASSSARRRTTTACKAWPGTPGWPADLVWDIFDLLLGGALVKTVPLAAPCFDDWPSVRNDTQCAIINANWKSPRFHIDDPASVIEPLYEGRTCLPLNAPGGNCTVGGFPVYVVNVTNVAQVQLAVNFARNLNLRLVVKNKGHDFLAKSTGGGALSIYTNWLRDVRFLENYSQGSYSGPAFKVGAGIEAAQMYQEADARNLSVVGGIGRTVGLAGGYSAGGGHSPIAGVFGMGADQVLSLEVVLPSGRFVTASPDVNPDLYWAMRGGGGSTFGVVTSAIIAAHPKVPVATAIWNITTSNPAANISTETFWRAVDAFWESIVRNGDAGHYTYFRLTCVTPTQPGNCTLAMTTHWANNMNAAQLKAHLAPLFAQFVALGIPEPPTTYAEYPSVWSAFVPTFPPTGESAGGTTIHTTSRLFPRANFADPALRNTTGAAIRRSLEMNGRLLGTAVAPAANPSLYQDNAVHPAWRTTTLFAQMANPWVEGASVETIANNSKALVGFIQPWRDVTPGSGAYLNEGDINEPNWQDAFYGSNYPRLLALKKKYDPFSVFYAKTAVGSEDWEVEGQIPYFPTTNGRLCRTAA
ncbi:FAD-binding domain-containing protein [Thozetella sp. PMI_491]|nr:FAD-binding domain-containing protein [Thozetella sp. PMI_491]